MPSSSIRRCRDAESWGLIVPRTGGCLTPKWSRRAHRLVRSCRRGARLIWIVRRPYQPSRSACLMNYSPEHRRVGVADGGRFAERFIRNRLKSFEKDIRICLTPASVRHPSGVTHAYFPALSACCGTLEYMAGLYRGNIRGIGDQHVANWANRFLPQPEYRPRNDQSPICCLSPSGCSSGHCEWGVDRSTTGAHSRAPTHLESPRRRAASHVSGRARARCSHQRSALAMSIHSSRPHPPEGACS